MVLIKGVGMNYFDTDTDYFYNLRNDRNDPRTPYLPTLHNAAYDNQTKILLVYAIKNA